MNFRMKNDNESEFKTKIKVIMKLEGKKLLRLQFKQFKLPNQ